MSSYKLLEIYRLIQAYNIPLNLNFQTVYKNPEKTLPRARPRNNRNFLGNSAHPNVMGQFAHPCYDGHLRGGAVVTAFFHHVCDCIY